jgi:glycosyltransferase involved in cell wall biosynthesis
MAGRRVGLVCGYFDPARDGVADYTRQLARHLRAVGLDTLICTARPHAARADADVVEVTHDWGFGGVGPAARKLARLGLDVVHVQFAPSAFRFSRAVGLLPALLPARLPLVVTLHEYGIWQSAGVGGRWRSAVWSAIERLGWCDRETLLLALRADRLLMSSQDHGRVLRRRFGDRALNAVYVPVGCNIPVPDACEVPLASRLAIRAGLGLPRDTLLVVFFGFLHPVKGLERLIEAVARVRRDRPEVRLVLAGGEESHSVSGAAARSLRRRLEDVALDLGVRHQLRFTGFLAGDDVSRLLQAADVAVLPFDAGVTDKSGTLLAALAHGLPTIATAPPGEVDNATVVDGILRIPPGDTFALTEALRIVLSDRALATSLTAAGRARAARQSWQHIAAIHTQMYVEALQRPRLDPVTSRPGGGE